jgi:uncharacterized protein YjbI with pentapeptide repeats
MANEEHLAILARGREEWNKWRIENAHITPDLRGAILSRESFFNVNFKNADLSKAQFLSSNLEETQFQGASMIQAIFKRATIEAANFTCADLTGANLEQVYAEDVIFRNADLCQTSLERADLWCADLTGANLQCACLRGTNLNGANLENANLTKADLTRAILTNVNLKGAILRQTEIYGLSAWDIKLDESTIQQDLTIVPPHLRFTDFTCITVDNIKVAQLIYLLLNNQEIRDVIDTITSKAVLILGRFSNERKPILDAIRNELRKSEHNYLPIVFDFQPSTNQTTIETIKTLANIARFVIADLTDARSVLQELQAIVPGLPSVAVRLLIKKSAHEYGMLDYIRAYRSVVEKTYEYESLEELVTSIKDNVIGPAEAKVKELRKRN